MINILHVPRCNASPIGLSSSSSCLLPVNLRFIADSFPASNDQDKGSNVASDQSVSQSISQKISQSVRLLTQHGNQPTLDTIIGISNLISTCFDMQQCPRFRSGMAGTERAAHAHHAREIGRYLVSYDDIGVNE